MATLLDDLLIVPTKYVLIGIFVGAVSGLAVAQFSPGPTLAAVADKAPFSSGKTLDTNLAHFNGRTYAIGSAPGVSLEPLSTSIVRKIAYGKTSFVSIATTASGVYSSDGLTDPHVRYPGIFVEPVRPRLLPFGGVYGWSNLTGWVNIPAVDAGSIGFLDWASLPANHDGACAKDTAKDTAGSTCS